MYEVNYNIHNIIKIKIHSIYRALFHDIDFKYSFFEVEDLEDPDIIIKTGRFRPDISGCKSFDHKFYVRKNYIYCKDGTRGLNWELEISGIEDEKLFINYSLKGYPLTYPWVLFPILALHLYILQPLLEIKLAQKGYYLIHGGAVTKNGKGLFLTGRGSSHKTSFVAELSRRGYKLLGDDMVILNNGKAFPFPLCTSLFNYFATYIPSTPLSIFDKVRLLLFLLAGRHKKSLIDISEPSYLNCLTVILKTNKLEPRISKDVDKNKAIDMLINDKYLENMAYVSYKYIIGKFLDVYNYFFPKANLYINPILLRKELEISFRDAEVKILEIPKYWNRRYVDMLLNS